MGTTPSPDCGGTAGMLPDERRRASFDAEGLRRLIRGNSTELIERFRPLFSGAPFDGEAMDDFRSYEDLARARMERAAAAMRITNKNPVFKKNHMSIDMKNRVAMWDMFGEAHLLQVHFTMFLAYIVTQASKEQQARWMLRAAQAKIIGAYAQTELGHGSNVRGIETTAHFDHAADEFIIHSPTLSSMKWWPTGMYGCTHAVVFARLIIGGTDHGYHGFMVQLRDEKGQCLEGVEVGEIGPKLNGTNPNIGYARFTHVRVPRFNLFARNQQVTRQGEYIAAPPKLSKFKYISMMIIRMGMVKNFSFRWLAKAATILVRYSCVRKQGFKDSEHPEKEAGGEHVIMDYRVQQYVAFKAIGLSYWFYWNAEYVTDFLQRVQKAVLAGDESGADDMPELHATCAGLKVASTIWAHDSIEECRRACGGQGFLLSSGVADLTRSFGVASTGEGAAVVLNLQVARFLMKAVRTLRGGGSVASSAAHLAGADPSPLPTPDGLRAGDPAALLRLLSVRARRSAVRLEAAFAKEQAAGAGFDAALNAVALRAYRAADCHSAYVMAKNNAEAVAKYVTEAPTRAVLTRLHELTQLMLVSEDPGSLLGVWTDEHAEAAEDRINHLLSALRPDAVALVDSFGFLDSELNSTLGRSDGNVYEAIYAAAKRSPLNQSGAMIGWEHIGPLLDRAFIAKGAKQQRVGAAKL